jgi:hypothetical protein
MEQSPGSHSRSISLAGQAPTDGMIKVEWTRGDDVTGVKDQDRLVARRIGDPRHLAIVRSDLTLVAPLRNGMGGDQGAVFKNLHLIGQRVHLNDPLSRRVGNAVKIATDAHHAS